MSFESKQFGKYYLLDKLAVGGMAEIYKAKTFGVDGFEKQLAIKRILPHCAADKDFIHMLIDEAKLSVLLSHANIVQVFDLGKVGDDYFIAMEFIHGVNLRDVVYHCKEKGDKIPLEIAVYICSEICKGLDYAHRKTDNNNTPLHIVHRDVSPQNVLISFEGEVKIVDFGIAKAAMNISHTMAGILKGKIAYMSPEQAMGKTVDSRTDIFSTGILLYEMLTGEKLFTGESQFEVLKKIRTIKIDASNLDKKIPTEIRAILAKALAYTVEERYENAGDFQIALTKYLYSSNSDFSPRKLAEFIRNTFKDEISVEGEKSAKESALEQQTSSMSIRESAKQVELVHRTPTPQKARALDAEITQGSASGEETTSRSGGKQKTSRNYLKPVLALLVLISLAASFAFFPKLQFWKKSESPVSSILQGSIEVRSTPSGASILIDGEKTYQTTPATLSEITLDEEHTVRLELDKHNPLEDKFTLKDRTTKELRYRMEAATGSMNIITDPSEAAISIDGRLTGMTTPATVENLPLNTDLKITLSKPDYEDFEQTVNLTNSKPQKISKTLSRLQSNQGSVFISSTPAGASVYIDDTETGRTTPATIGNIDFGKHKVELKMKGFTSWSQSIDVAGTKTLQLEASLASTEQVKAAEEKQAPKPETAKPATLAVTSSPAGATVFLEGKKKGETPLSIPELLQGKTYSLRLEKDGYKAAYRKKSLQKEKESLNVSLTEEKAEVKTPTPAPADETPQRQGGKPGKIVLKSNPSNADVFINGDPKGTTPLTVSVDPGNVSIIVTKEGRARFVKKMKLKSGETINLSNITLGDLYGEVSISTTPPGASVVIDGQNTPPTPVIVKKVRTDQPHTIEVKLKGYKTWKRTFDMDSSGETRFNIILEK